MPGKYEKSIFWQDKGHWQRDEGFCSGQKAWSPERTGMFIYNYLGNPLVHQALSAGDPVPSVCSIWGSDAWPCRIMITHLDWPCQSPYPHNPHSVVSADYNQNLSPSSNQYIERNFNFKMNLIFFFHLYAMNLVKGNCQQWPFSGSFLLSKKNKIRHRHNRRKEFLPLNSLL